MTTIFRKCLAACGLSQDEAVVVLGQSKASIAKKSAGTRRMTERDRLALERIFTAVREGRVEGLPDGPVEMARALRFLSGADDVDRPV